MIETEVKEFNIGVENKLQEKILSYDCLIPSSLKLISCFRTYVPFVRRSDLAREISGSIRALS